ncbi:MAG TPA: PepSY-associated TM helix domain-containing protein, partial [Polyangiaceae bacterium]|nr:PepSY-associated TM helix domain-containing protein [Polyangiaceae bacterium]
MRWRPLLLSLHRDIGFLCVGLTIVYAVSGIAVNHAHHWNYDRSETHQSLWLGHPADLLQNASAERKQLVRSDPSQMTPQEEQTLVRAIGEKIGRPLPPRNVFWRGPYEILAFWGQGDDDMTVYHVSSGMITHTLRKDRWIIRSFNALHLNERHGPWTFIADAFALLLCFLAVSGMLIVRGPRGIKGRGGIFLAIGVAIPILAL